MVEFLFTPSQRVRALLEGTRRQTENEAKRLKGRNNAPVAGDEALQMHLKGAAAELAVAVYLDMEDLLYADSAPVRGSCDLPGIDVKCRSRHYYDLLVQLDDDPSKIFVLVTIENRRTFIHGWVHGVNAMNKAWIRSFIPGRPCYTVPKEYLNPIEDLKCQLAAVQKERIGG